MKEETYKIIGIFIFGIGFFIVFAAIFLFSMQDMSAKINISNESIQLDGFIHYTVDFDEINKVEYLDDFEIHGGKKGAGFSNNGYFSGDADFKDMNSVWDAWVEKGFAPARACVEAKMAREALLVEISIVAAVK